MLNISTRTSTPATADQLAALKIELAKPDYTGLSDAETAQRINRGVYGSNPVAQSYIFRESVTRDYFFSALLAVTEAMEAKDPTDPQRLVFESVIDYINNNNIRVIALTSANQGFLNTLVTNDVMTQDALNNDFKVLDPSWKSLVQLVAPVANVLFPGQRVQVEASDIAHARAS